MHHAAAAGVEDFDHPAQRLHRPDGRHFAEMGTVLHADQGPIFRPVQPQADRFDQQAFRQVKVGEIKPPGAFRPLVRGAAGRGGLA